MSKRTNVYRSRAKDPAEGQPRRGLLGRFRSGRTRGRSRRRRDLLVLLLLASAVPIAVGSLGASWLIYRQNHDWTSVASVNSNSINRETLRARMAVIEFLAQQRVSFVTEQALASDFTPDTAHRLISAAQTPLADPVDAARESLIDDELLRQMAAREGFSVPPQLDKWDEATRYATGDEAQRLRYVQFGLAATSSSSPAPASSGSPTPPGTPSASTPPGQAGASWPQATKEDLAAATERLKAELSGGTPVETIVAGLRAAGWEVRGEDVAMTSGGASDEPSVDLEPAIAAEALAARAGAILGPATNGADRTAVALVLPGPNTANTTATLRTDAAKAGVDEGALQSWADGQTLRRSVDAALLTRWSGGVSQARFRELVVGTAPDSSATAGPWVELSSLATDNLRGVNPASINGAPQGLDLTPAALAKSLASMSVADRERLFSGLAAAANIVSSTAANRSGEIGFYTKDSVVPDLGKAAFATGVKAGDVLGPIATGSGPELFLLEARYPGALDDRAKVRDERRAGRSRSGSGRVHDPILPRRHRTRDRRQCQS